MMEDLHSNEFCRHPTAIDCIQRCQAEHLNCTRNPLDGLSVEFIESGMSTLWPGSPGSALRDNVSLDVSVSPSLHFSENIYLV